MIAEDVNSIDILKPVLRGRDIKRYQADWAGLWLIDAHNGYGIVPAVDIGDYPAIKTHLDKFYPKLSKRYDKGRTPYNLRNCAYHEEFTKEKLFWMDLTERGRFVYVEGEMFCANTAYVLSGKSVKYLCAMLNSELITWFLKHTALNSGMGVPRWIRFTVERLPIPQIPIAEQQPFIRLVDQILKAKVSNPKTNIHEQEAEIDRLVYELYGITLGEIESITLRTKHE